MEATREALKNFNMFDTSLIWLIQQQPPVSQHLISSAFEKLEDLKLQVERCYAEDTKEINPGYYIDCNKPDYKPNNYILNAIKKELSA